MCESRKATAIASLLPGKKYVDGNGGSCALAAPDKTTPMTAATLEKAQRHIAENPLFQPGRPWMYSAPTVQHPLCNRIEAISCFASNHALKKPTGEPQRHGTIAPNRLPRLVEVPSRLAQIEPLQDPTHGPKLMPFHGTAASGILPTERTKKMIATIGPIIGPHMVAIAG